MKKNIRIGLIGVGKMGQNHLRVLSLLKGTEIKFIYDINFELANKYALNYGVVAVSDPCAMLDEVDAVVIASPTNTHFEMIKKIGNRVKNIFVEKPLASNLDEANELFNFCKKNNLNVQVGFIERFNAAVQAVKQIINENKLVISVDFTRTNKLSSRITDVDVVADLMIHDIDLSLYLNGPADNISAHGYSSNGMIDFASALISHKNGRFSRIQASRVTDKKMRLIQVTSKDMYIDCDLLRREILINKQSEIKDQEGRLYTISGIQEAVEVRPQEALLTELQVFLDSCNGSYSADRPTVQDGLSSMEICQRIQLSILS